ncbi:MAG: hypothetical protein WA210_21840 [Burkholderiaceae bacterium]
MAPADAKALEPYLSLLRQLREVKGLKEVRPGIFYLRGSAFLNFHDEAGVLVADLKKPGGSGFDRYGIASPPERRKLLDAAKLRAARADDD